MAMCSLARMQHSAIIIIYTCAHAQRGEGKKRVITRRYNDIALVGLTSATSALVERPINILSRSKYRKSEGGAYTRAEIKNQSASLHTAVSDSTAVHFSIFIFSSVTFSRLIFAGFWAVASLPCLLWVISERKRDRSDENFSSFSLAQEGGSII